MSAEIPPRGLAIFDQALAQTETALDDLVTAYRGVLGEGLRSEVVMVGMAQRMQMDLTIDVMAQILVVSIARLAKAHVGE